KCGYGCSFSAPLVWLLEQGGGNEVEHRSPALRQKFGRERIPAGHHAHDRRICKIEHNHCDHSWDEMHWIDAAEFPFALPITENGGKPSKHWTKILFGDALKMWGASATAAH